MTLMENCSFVGVMTCATAVSAWQDIPGDPVVRTTASRVVVEETSSESSEFCDAKPVMVDTNQATRRMNKLLIENRIII
jgi:hypothetical protein